MHAHATSEVDSDSDFNEKEIIVPESTKGRKRRDGKANATLTRTRGKRKVVGEDGRPPKRTSALSLSVALLNAKTSLINGRGRRSARIAVESALGVFQYGSFLYLPWMG